MTCHLPSRLLLRAAIAACLSAPAFAADVTIATAQGPATVAANPATVAVYDVAAIDTLHALGVMPAGVPANLYVSYLGDVAAAATPIGTLFEPDLEAAAALAPDLIIVGGRSSTQVEALSPIAPVIDMTIWEDVPTEARARITAYGALFGKDDKAAELVAAYDAKIAAVQAAAAGKGRALIVLTNGPKVSAYGKGSRFGWIHDALAIPEAREKLDPEIHGDAVSFEFIAEVNPDWLLVIDRGSATGEGGQSAAATLDNPLVAGTTAAQKGQIVYLNAANIYISGGGYTSIMGTMDELLTALSK